MAQHQAPPPADLPPKKKVKAARQAVRDAAVAVRTGNTGEDVGLYRLLVESVTDYAIFALSAEGKIITWNQGARRIKGYEADEVIGHHIRKFYTPEDQAAGRPQMLLGRAARDGHVEDLGWRVRKDGSRFWASVVITALHDDSGALVGYAKVVRDLTERRIAEEALRQSEERFRLIVQSIRDYGVYMLDTKGNVVSWNDGAERIKGYTAADVIGRHFSRFYPAAELEAGTPDEELRTAAIEGRFEDEGWRVRKDGSLFWASVIINAVRNERGQLIGFVKITRDLSERRAAHERALADARRIASAEASSRAKTEFLAAMSHELRTPLNAIGGYIELLQMGVGGAVSAQQGEYLERVRTAQQHLLALINDLLNYSRIEAGQVTYDVGPVRVGELIHKVALLIEAQATRKELELTTACDADTTAVADRVKVEQILLNLLSNAVKFTPPGGRIAVTCVVEEGRAAIVVEDSGPGVPTEMRDAIFEPFVQLGRSLTSSQEGTGLGLAISRDLARAMRGDIVVTAAEGGGARFTLTLPTA